jgi:hypothetical protein
MRTPHTSSLVTFRRATAEDEPALRRLARLDDRRLPSGDLVLAQVGAEVQAAVSIDGHAAVADPWRPTAGLVHALRAFALRTA